MSAYWMVAKRSTSPDPDATARSKAAARKPVAESAYHQTVKKLHARAAVGENPVLRASFVPTKAYAMPVARFVSASSATTATMGRVFRARPISTCGDRRDRRASRAQTIYQGLRLGV